MKHAAGDQDHDQGAEGKDDPLDAAHGELFEAALLVQVMAIGQAQDCARDDPGQYQRKQDYTQLPPVVRVIEFQQGELQVSKPFCNIVHAWCGFLGDGYLNIE